MMYPGTTNPESYNTYAHYEHRSTVPNSDYTHSHGYYRHSLEPPRPLEPRPPLHTSLSESFTSHNLHDGYRGSHVQAEHRSQGQNLPGLREILSPASPTPGHHSSYSSGWNPNATPHSSHHSSESFPSLPKFHPPMAFHPPPTETCARYQSQQSRAFDVPILETSPVSRQPPQSLPVSPYAGYPEGVRDHPDRNSHTQGPSGYVTNDAPSPYPYTPYDEPQSRPRSAYTQVGTENHGKYVGLRDLPGEGQFYVYEDGHRIPTHVDGEQVNPAWGLTKANKPRKRLALACMDCREKKIKCEPGVQSCLQCEKAMRPCRRAPQQQSQPDTPTPSLAGVASSPPRKNASNSDPTPLSSREKEADPVNKRRSREDVSPPNVPTKKHRSATPVLSLDDISSQTRVETSVGSSSWPEAPRDRPLAWEEGPYAVLPEITLHLLDLYFAHINNGILCMLPRDHIMEWLVTCTPKCQNERLVLYAMLAAASVFAGDELSSIGKQCAQIAGDALSMQRGRYHVSLIQSYLLLAFYHFAKGSGDLAWEYCGSAIRSVTYMGLNTEDGCLDDEASKAFSRYEFSMSPAQLAELKRRTFWSCFISDRFSGANMCQIKPEDVFVRLPQSDEMYERGVVSHAPYLSNDIMDPAASLITPASPLAPVGWLVMPASIWGDVCDFLFRASHRGALTYRDEYEFFYDKTLNLLQGWRTRLPDHLQYSEANLDRSIQEGYAGTFVTMHVLYHFSLMRLNRSLRHTFLPESVVRNIREAHFHGHEILRIMVDLSVVRRNIATPAEGRPSMFVFTIPFPGYAALSAIDVVSAGGADTTLGATINEIEAGLGCLRELSMFWNSAKDQLKVSEKRFYQIKNILTGTQRAPSGAWLGRNWGLALPLEGGYEAESDCIYGLGDTNEAMELYFNAFKSQGGSSKAAAGVLRIA